RSANFTLEQKIQPGDLVRYTGSVPWILKLWGNQPVEVISCVGDCLTLPLPDKPGETGAVTPDNWELVP
ncbi:hypothetical protein, partial [Gloeomargarita lithophora]|uniref:hypothetical protein n=1 Tax=Gloeomargarita lithophora TaxID=1188228 RepID=UPI001560226A